jgi:hypothetical protein
MILCLLLREGWEVFKVPWCVTPKGYQKPTCNNQRASLPCVAGGEVGAVLCMHLSLAGQCPERVWSSWTLKPVFYNQHHQQCVMLNEMGPFRFSFAFGGWCVGKGGDDGVTDRC